MSTSVDERNRQTSAAEVFAFAQRWNGGRYFAYWKQGDATTPNTLTTWTGERLAIVTWFGADFRSYGFGRPSTRVNFTAHGIDGRIWNGTYYKSSGDYVRMRASKKVTR